MNRVLISMLLLLWSPALRGQNQIKGLLFGADSKPIAGLNVGLSEKGSSILVAFAISDEKGRFQLSYSGKDDSLLLSISGFNVAKQQRLLANRNQDLSFQMLPQAIRLKEIKVNPPKIRRLGDTLNYLVDVFKDQNDRTIGDVLRKMPGIVVRDDGSILYNNKPINKFYIEGKDLLQGRYGIATNNLEAKDVASVQVLENHQPIKALKDKEFTDEGAINLKLKDTAKGILTAKAQLGSGVLPLLWNNELSTMYFDKERQLMNVYKGNNTGQDAATEHSSFYGGAGSVGQAANLSVQTPSSPGISQHRYLRNRSHAATLNQLWSYGKDYQLTANLNYLNDHQLQEGFSKSLYYLPGDSLLEVAENLNSSQQINKLTGSLQLNANRPQYYIDNALRFSGVWDQQKGGITGTSELDQKLRKPQFNINNSFSLISNVREKTLKLSSSVAYSHVVQTLLIRPLLYPELFEKGVSNEMHQEVSQRHLSSQNRLSYGWNRRHFIQNYAVGINLYATQFGSVLYADSQNESQVPDSLINNLQWNTMDAYFAPDYVYTADSWRATLQLPLSYASLRNNLFFNPSFNIRQDISPLWHWTAAARFNQDIGGLENGYRSYIMHSYRNLSRNDGQLPRKKSQAYSLDFGYRHPIHAVFINLGGSYSVNEQSILYGSEYIGVRATRLAYDIPNGSRATQVYGKFSKAINFLESTINLNANYHHSRALQVSQARLIGFSAELYGLSAGLASKFGKWGSLNCQWNYSSSISEIDDAARRNPIHQQVQNAKLNLFPTKSIVLNLGFERFYNSALTGNARSMNFADLGAKLNWKRLEFNLEYNNVLNTREYLMSSYSEISAFYSSYQLRPAQVLLKVRFKIK